MKYSYRSEGAVSLYVLLVLTVIGFFASGYLRSNAQEEKEPTPRDLHGIDTLRTDDSLYVIKFKIIKVLPDTTTSEDEGYDNY